MSLLETAAEVRELMDKEDLINHLFHENHQAQNPLGHTGRDEEF